MIKNNRVMYFCFLEHSQLLYSVNMTFFTKLSFDVLFSYKFKKYAFNLIN